MNPKTEEICILRWHPHRFKISRPKLILTNLKAQGDLRIPKMLCINSNFKITNAYTIKLQDCTLCAVARLLLPLLHKKISLTAWTFSFGLLY